MFFGQVLLQRCREMTNAAGFDVNPWMCMLGAGLEQVSGIRKNNKLQTDNDQEKQKGCNVKQRSQRGW